MGNLVVTVLDHSSAWMAVGYSVATNGMVTSSITGYTIAEEEGKILFSFSSSYATTLNGFKIFHGDQLVLTQKCTDICLNNGDTLQLGVEKVLLNGKSG